MINNNTITATISSDSPTFTGQILKNASMSSTSPEESGLIIGQLLGTALRGLSNYELAVRNGFQGTEQEYLDSLKCKIEVIEDTETSYVLKFSVGDGDDYVISPNLKAVAEYVQNQIHLHNSDTEAHPEILQQIITATSWQDF